MNFALDARGINWYKGTGIGTYTDNLLKYMLINNENDSLHIFWSGDNYKQYKNENSHIIMTSKKYHKFFEQNYFPSYIRNNDISVLHVPQNGIGLSDNIPCKKVVTVHDLIPYIIPETVGRGYLLKFLKFMPDIIAMSDAIITVSTESKNTILKFFPIDEKKIYVIPLAADSKYLPLNKNTCKNVVKTKFNISKPFILYLGGFSPRKNVKSLIYAFKKSISNLDKEYDLVLAGSDRNECQEIKSLINDLNISDNIKFTGFLEEELLPIFYNSCDLFVYPSLYEGFGLPPLEAMCCGAPVLSSNLSSIPEVVGTGGILVNPTDVNELSDNIIKILNNIELQDELKSNALNRAKKFSWSITAKKTLDVYNSI